MAPQMREYLQQTWRRIQQRIPGSQFNFDFWTSCEPRRSTWPACRAVIAAREQGAENDERMTRAIQEAYYLRARNPSDEAVLVTLAGEPPSTLAIARPVYQRELAWKWQTQWYVAACFALGTPANPPPTLSP